VSPLGQTRALRPWVLTLGLVGVGALVLVLGLSGGRGSAAGLLTAIAVLAMAEFAALVALSRRHGALKRSVDDENRRHAESLAQLHELEERLTHQAFHDPLTNLANRALFIEMLRRTLVRHERDGARAAVLFLDLDDFKSVNDSFGHAVGDEVLVAVSGRLRGCMRAGDTAARLGGDEFAILIDDAHAAAGVLGIAERILRALEPPIAVYDRELAVRGSIGVAFSGKRGTAEGLLRDADIAMYRAKGHGKGRYEVFEDGMESAILHKMELRTDLARGIHSEQLVLHYQPIVDLASAEIVAVEALVRWQHPERGLVPPGEFIELAEETGLIGELGSWVLGEACRQAAEWRARFPAARRLGMSVNVSASQLRQTGFAREVLAALEATGADPSSLTLEITESVFMQGWTRMSAALEELRGLGVRLAIDDFGTGYSSLSRLMEMPVDTLKIPKPFVDALAGVSGGARLARTVVRIGDSIGMKTVAEGIETVDRWRQLRHLGCDLGQGYLFGRPVPAAELETKLVQVLGGVHSRDRRPNGVRLLAADQAARRTAA
jgi:diguanylate cyclase (GGDEF)-like protein